MSETTHKRPTQATLGGWLVVSASVFLVISLFSTISTLRSLETRQRVEEALAEPGVGGLGLGVQDALTLLHVAAMVAGGLAAATTVLGVFALQRHRQARVALSVLALPLLVTGFVSGNVLALVVVLAVTMLWMQPSRDWYDGKAPRDPREQDAAGADPRPAPAEPDESPQPWQRSIPQDQPSAARPYQGFGAPGPAGGGTDTLPRPWGAPAGSGPATRPARGRRPAAVVVACVSAWVCSGLALALVAVGLYQTLADPGPLLDQVRAQQPEAFEQGVTEQALIVATAVMFGVLAVWALAAVTLAAFAFRGANGARIGLLVSAGLVGVPAVFLGLLAPLLLPLAAGAAVTFAGLLRAEARAWYAAPSSEAPPSG